MEYKNLEPSIIQEKDQVLKLCKRLKNCTLNELVQFLEVDEKIIETVLIYLEQEELININNGVITIKEKNLQTKRQRKNLFLMFQYQSEEKVQLILKGFCLNIPPQKMALLLDLNKSCLCDYYNIFRKLIYEYQFKELLKLYFENPQISRYRIFYERYAYFYVYNKQVFISEKVLKATLEKKYTKDEVREFKRMYSYLSRIESHNINERYMYYRLAEYIWRHEKDFEELYHDIQNLIK